MLVYDVSNQYLKGDSREQSYRKHKRTLFILLSIILKGMLRNIPIVVVNERITPVKNRFPVTFSTYMEKIGEVIPQPKV